jgi:hypothetical protein
MSRSKQTQIANAETANAKWKSLYRIGGAAPLITLACYLTEVLAIIFGEMAGEPYPSAASDWLALFQRNKVLGLLYLNALDVFSIAILGTMFLALYVALKRTSASYMAIAVFFAFIGIAAFVSSRADTVSASLSLSSQYAAATAEAQRAQILTAWQAVEAPVRATPQTIGFLLIALASSAISIVMLQSKRFGKASAYVGILAGVVTLADHIWIVVAPSTADALMPIDGLLWFVWWIMVSRRLFQLGRRAARAN